MGIEKIAKIAKESISNEEYNKDKFLPTLKVCKECAKTFDAIDYLCNYFFANENCKSLKKGVSIETTECKWNHDYHEFLDKIVETFENNVSTDIYKGFVYIFWKACPLEYLYVGETTDQGVPRLLDRTNTGVVQSSSKATLLTIIYPSHPNYIKNIEASIIRVIEDFAYNRKYEKFSGGKSDLSKRLSELEGFLGL